MSKEIIKLFRCIGWDLRVALRYNIVTVTVIMTILYTLIIKLIPGANITVVLASLIFSDPTMLGFIFIGAIILFEKDANTLQALAVTPINAWQYLWSKAIALTIIALVCSCGIAIAGHGLQVNFFWLIVSTTLSSFLFIFIGITGVSKVKSFNHYIILIPLFLLPTVLPLLDFYGIFESWIFYLIPTQGSLLLFRAAFEGASTFDIIYSICVLGISITVAYKIAERHFLNYLIGKIN